MIYTMCSIKILRATSPLRCQRRSKTYVGNMFNRGMAFFFSKRTLVYTNSITSGGCMALGDLAQQESEYQSKLLPERYDWARCARMFIVGTVMGPLHHVYYVYLDKILPRADLKTVGIKILCDQLIASPLTILYFFIGMGTLEKKTATQITKEMKEKFIYVYMGDCLFWPPIQFINFYYLPTRYRVLYINAATMIFNVFLSFMKHYDQH